MVIVMVSIKSTSACSMAKTAVCKRKLIALIVGLAYATKTGNRIVRVQQNILNLRAIISLLYYFARLQSIVAG